MNSENILLDFKYPSSKILNNRAIPENMVLMFLTFYGKSRTLKNTLCGPW